MAELAYMGSPVKQFLDDNGDPLNGGKVYFFEPGTSTPKDTYSDFVPTANPNPVILDARGEAVIILDGEYKVVLNDSSDNLVWSEDNYKASGVSGDVVSEWTSPGDTVTFISATQFSVPDDLRTTYQIGRRVKCTVTAGTVYGTIVFVAYTTLTTVTVRLDSGSLDSGLSVVDLGLLTVTNLSIPVTQIEGVGGITEKHLTPLGQSQGGQHLFSHDTGVADAYVADFIPAFTRLEGTADGTTANKLVDSTATFTADMVGRDVYNRTDDTHAIVTGFDSSTQLSVSSNIFASGEIYIIGSFLHGTKIKVHMMQTNTIANPTLNINGTGAHEITRHISTTGTTDNTVANKLEDSTATFTASIEIGMKVHNETDDSWATVTAIDSDTVLSLDTDIMTTGEDYKVTRFLTAGDIHNQHMAELIYHHPDWVLLNPTNVLADVISERSDNTGVTVDGVLLKDGLMPSSAVIPNLTDGSVYTFTDFLAGSAAYDENWEEQDATGVGTFSTPTGVDGWARVVTTGTNKSGWGRTNSEKFWALSSGKTIIFETKIDYQSSTHDPLIGLWSDILNVAGTDGIFFDHNTGTSKIRVTTRASSTSTATDLDIDYPVAEITLKIVATTTSVKFYVDGVEKAEHTTNIPTANLAGCVGVDSSSALEIDYAFIYKNSRG